MGETEGVATQPKQTIDQVIDHQSPAKDKLNDRRQYLAVAAVGDFVRLGETPPPSDPQRARRIAYEAMMSRIYSVGFGGAQTDLHNRPTK